MEQLNGRFSVEPGNGGSREGYLADHKVETYLIVHPSETNVCNTIIFKYFQYCYLHFKARRTVSETFMCSF